MSVDNCQTPVAERGLHGSLDHHPSCIAVSVNRYASYILHHRTSQLRPGSKSY
jgi:hypothetical protein